MLDPLQTSRQLALLVAHAKALILRACLQASLKMLLMTQKTDTENLESEVTGKDIVLLHMHDESNSTIYGIVIS